MDPITGLTKATKLVIQDLEWNLSYHVDLADSTLTSGSGGGGTSFTVDKPVGQLQFTINSGVFRFKQLKTNFDIIFTGQQINANTVKWTPSLGQNTVVKLDAGSFGTHSATIVSVSGSLTTTVSALPQPEFENGDIYATVSLQSSSQNDNLHFKADIDYDGPGTPSLYVDFTNVVITALAGILGNLSLSIYPTQANFGPPFAALVEGNKYSFHAILAGVPDGAVLAYQWAANPATLGQIAASPGSNQQICSVIVINDGTLTLTKGGTLTMVVKVTMTVQNQAVSFTCQESYQVISREEANWITRWLQMLQNVNPIVNPLLNINPPDPGPEQAIKQLLSREFLSQSYEFGTYLSNTSRALLDQRGRSG